MKLEYAPPDGDAIVLGDDASGMFTTLDEMDHQRSVDQVQMFDAPAEQTLATGNLRNTRGFTVDIEHESADAAAEYLSDHPDALPGQGVLTWTTGSTVRRMSDATLTRVHLVKLDGRSTVLHYSFTGGLITAGPTTDPAE